jgi:transcriptional regulator with XRE-family HTH domain
VTDNAPHPDEFLATRIDLLLRSGRPGDPRPHTPAEVAEAINADAGDDVISGTYIWQLRTGRRDNPTYKHLIALSRFFGVSPTYFFDESETARGAVPADVAFALRDDAVRTLALRAAGLSEHSLKAINDMVTSARALESPPGRGRPAARRRQAAQEQD